MGEVNEWHALNTFKCLRTITGPSTTEVEMLSDLRVKMMNKFIHNGQFAAFLYIIVN